MSIQSVEAILTKAMGDKAFASLLFSHSEQALVGFDLTDEEAASLKSMTHADFDAHVKMAPEERKSIGDQWGLSTGNHNDTVLKAQS